MSAWLLGSILFIGISGWRMALFHRALARTQSAPNAVRRLADEVASHFSLSGRYGLRITEGRLPPLVWPVGRPTIVLPRHLVSELSSEELKTLLAHELAHLRRHDHWVRWLELVVTAIYWWHPVVWLARKEIQRAEEEACDTWVVAALPNSAERYASALFKAAQFISEHRPPEPILASALGSGGNLKERIEHVMNTTRQPRLRLSVRVLVLCLAALLLPLTVGSVEATSDPQPTDGQATTQDEPSNAPLATVEEVIESLQSSEEAVKSLIVKYHCESEMNLVRPGSKPQPEFPIEDDAVSMKRVADVSWEVLADGRGRMNAQIRRTNTRFDGSTNTKHEEFTSAFDGSTAAILTARKQPDGTEISRRVRLSQQFDRSHHSPFDFSTQHLGTPISQLLVERAAVPVQMERWEDRPVVVVEASPFTVRDDYIVRHRFWVDLERGIAVRRQSFVQRGEGKPWALHLQIDGKQHTEVKPGIWLPKVVDTWNYHVTTEGQDFLVSKEHFEVSEWKVNEDIDESRLVPDFSAELVGHASGVTPSISSELPSNAEQAQKIRVGTSLAIRIFPTVPDDPIGDVSRVDLQGRVALGPLFGRVKLEGMTIDEAEAAIIKHLESLEVIREPRVQVTFIGNPSESRPVLSQRDPYHIKAGDIIAVTVSNGAPDAPIDGDFMVEPSGAVPLGPLYGRVKVAGMTLEEAETAVAAHLRQQLRDPKVQITIGGWRDRATSFAERTPSSPGDSLARARQHRGPRDVPAAVAANEARNSDLDSFRSSQPALVSTQNLAPEQAPPRQANAQELEAMREHVRFLENHFKKADALFQSGSRGGSALARALAGHELAAARGELSFAVHNIAEARTRFAEAQKYAEQALAAAQAEYSANTVQGDVLLQAARNLAEVKRRLGTVQQSASSGDHTPSNATTSRDSALQERAQLESTSSGTESLGVLKKIAERAKIDYDRVNELAEQKVVSATELARAKSDYEIAIERLRQAERGLRYYQLLLESAEADYQMLLETNKRAPNTVTKPALRKAKLAVELARAKLEELSE
jgi:protein involved in polysaccharide export with SLBB domain